MKGWIYQIFNKVTLDFYIGSTTSLYKRKHSHIKSLKDNKHHNKHLQNAYNKYKGNFQFLIIEEIENCTKELLIEREQYYIDKLQPKYNILTKAYSNLGYKHTDEARKKISQASSNASEITREKQSIALLGIPKTKEHSDHISQGKKGKRMKQESINKMALTKKGQEHSIESNLKRSYTMLGKNYGSNNLRSLPVIQINKDTNEFIKEWSCRTDIERNLNYNGANIHKCCHGKREQANGFKWKFKKDINMKEENGKIFVADKASKTVALSNLFVKDFQ